MSYNPGFELDEAALDGSSSGGASATAGVKLTSFKQLSVDEPAAQPVVNNSFSAQQASTRQTLIELANAAASQNAAIAAAAAAKQRQSDASQQQLVSLATSSSSASSTSSSSSPVSSPSPSSTLQNLPTKHYATSSSTCAAVECRDLMYDVGFGSNQKTILHKINVTVPEGSIYGLLGPSGCGKTTLLRCIIGRVKPRSGNVRVFGYKPNEAGSQIPGAAIGYMPQEISVYDDFTINETLTFFGKINRMKRDLIRARIAFLIEFLDLPGKNRLVGSLSGGQKRRVSLAAALVHSPPLLILDEPTVGVDPLLRQSIWKHLVTLAQTEKITVLITTHYIEEARQANVVGLMRHGKLLAEDSPDNLMVEHALDSLEAVFLKLCISDSSRRAARLATGSATDFAQSGGKLNALFANGSAEQTPELLLRCGNLATSKHSELLDSHGSPLTNKLNLNNKQHALPSNVFTNDQLTIVVQKHDAKQHHLTSGSAITTNDSDKLQATHLRKRYNIVPNNNNSHQININNDGSGSVSVSEEYDEFNAHNGDENSLTEFVVNKHNLRSMVPGTKYAPKKVSAAAWTMSLLAVTWKNYIRLKRNYPVLLFEFILPAVQVILFCLCIGGDPFDVPLAVVNDEVIPQASRFFLDAIDKNTIRQIKYDNLTEAIASVRRGETWGAIHIPDRYTHYLQERLTHPADITNDTLTNGTINIYPDLTNLHLALAMENTFREAFIKFAKDTLNMFGYDPAAAELPIRVEKPVYGTLAHNGYLEFMAPGVVISITYVMATGLTALAFILEKRDGLLERSLVSGVTTSQILLAHASVQVIVMAIQIGLVLAFTFFVFQIPSHGPFAWVVLLILLQGCTGMGFGLLVSALCDEENTAVMMLVGTFYTNLILAGIIWPLEAMPQWLRWLSYMQPQTLPTEALRNILSRGWGIASSGVYLGFVVTIGWLVVFLLAAGIAMRYSK